MRNKAVEYLNTHKNELFEFGDILFKTPELGFKEFKTKALLKDKLNDDISEFAYTGFSVSMGEGHPHIGLIAEMDAIPTLGHPYANHEDKDAAHACGHSTQCAIMTYVYKSLKEAGIPCGKVTLFFTPAEEYTDLEYRQELIDKGILKTPSGKTNMLLDGIFDDVDICLHLHAMGPSECRFAVDSKLAGFIYKKITFHGKASHAAVLPQFGVNALNMFALFQSAAAMLRETFVDEDKNRVHGILIEGGQTVNSIPERVVYECYVRSFNTETLKELSEKLNNCAIHCAMSLGGEATIEDKPGYLPFVPDPLLAEVPVKHMMKFGTKFKYGERSVAAGDIGDLGLFKPTIQMGYGGFKGRIHGNNLEIEDESRVYYEPSIIMLETVYDLLENKDLTKSIVDNFKVGMTMEGYKKYLGI